MNWNERLHRTIGCKGRQTARRFFKVNVPLGVWQYFLVGCSACLPPMSRSVSLEDIMSAEVIVKCKSCGYTIHADHSWAERIAPGATYPSSTSIYSFLTQIKSKLRCSQCGSKNCNISYELPTPSKKESSISEHEKRYIDEGLAGTREGHKRMRSQQWYEMIRRHREWRPFHVLYKKISSLYTNYILVKII